jgi:hypothetical protein
MASSEKSDQAVRSTIVERLRQHHHNAFRSFGMHFWHVYSILINACHPENDQTTKPAADSAQEC